MRKETALGIALVLTLINGVLVYGDLANDNIQGGILIACIFFWGAGLMIKE